MAKESDIIKKRMIRLIGLAYLLLGFIFLLGSFNSITGFVIAENMPEEIGWIIGLVFLGIGIFVIAAAREAVILVYESENGTTKEDRYRIKNSGLSSRWDDLSLKEFRDAINKIRQEKDGEELLKMAKEDCVPDLEKMVEEGGRKAEVAERFLQVLEPDYKIQEEKDDYRLSKKEREEIKRAFRTYDGTLGSQEKSILKKYNLSWDYSGSNHIKINYQGTGKNTFLPGTPSDKRSALNNTITLIKLIEEGRKEIAKKSKKK